jgi:hypothetical protein
MPRGPKGEKRTAEVIGAAVMVGSITTSELDQTETYPPVGTFEICRDVCPVVAIGGEADMGWTAHFGSD